MFEIIKGIWNLFLEFTGFLFDTDFTKSKAKFNKPFTDVPAVLRLPDGSEDISSGSRDLFSAKNTAMLEVVFGKETAKYISSLRDNVNDLVKENTIEYADSVYVVMPPEKFPGDGLSPAIIDNIMESVYAQFNGDVILKPGKINVFITESGLKYAEMYIDYYKPTEEFVMNS